MAEAITQTKLIKKLAKEPIYSLVIGQMGWGDSRSFRKVVKLSESRHGKA